MNEKIRVLIVDDSDFVRETLRSILDAEPEIEVVETAGNGEEGLEKACKLRPSVITMDLEMPFMSGYEAIDRVMKEVPTPIIVVSSMNTEAVVKTLDLGAMDFISLSGGVEAVAEDLIEKVKIASRVKPLRRIKSRPGIKATRVGITVSKIKVVAIGISTGGPQALKTFFSGIPPDFPAGILVVQHMFPGFIGGMVEWLNNYSSIDIRIPKQFDLLGSARAFIAPDNRHMEVGADGKIRLSDGNNDGFLHVPSIDVMMKSVAAAYGESAIGVVMTGMGRDGVAGLRAIRESGGRTIAQDEDSSAIYGMNRVAIEEGIVDKIVPLEDIPTELIRAMEKGSEKNGPEEDTHRRG